MEAGAPSERLIGLPLEWGSGFPASLFEGGFSTASPADTKALCTGERVRMRRKNGETTGRWQTGGNSNDRRVGVPVTVLHVFWCHGFFRAAWALPGFRLHG
ncbi:MAG: hypothetical protein KatS3mg132_488 [Limisphaera sp.]|nr:MAG: hypothetical protein KatS3mg132_488 [Limisphaera sp.]